VVRFEERGRCEWVRRQIKSRLVINYFTTPLFFWPVPGEPTMSPHRMLLLLHSFSLYSPHAQHFFVNSWSHLFFWEIFLTPVSRFTGRSWVRILSEPNLAFESKICFLNNRFEPWWNDISWVKDWKLKSKKITIFFCKGVWCSFFSRFGSTRTITTCTEPVCVLDCIMGLHAKRYPKR